MNQSGPDSKDDLVRHLRHCEAQLREWIASSPGNAAWLARDPMGAIRAAKLNVSEDVLDELESVLLMIAAKIRAQT